MMHRCSNSHGNNNNNMMGGPCSCGLYHCQNNSSSFSMLFSMSAAHETTHYDNHHHMYSFTSPSSVDCTLSLGTPSTRGDSDHPRKQESTRRSGFCWDLLQPSKYSHQAAAPVTSHKSGRGSSNNCGGGGGGGGGGGDSLLARRCANCDTTSTPLWRNGPRGPKSLCNACGIRFKKEERRATAAAATNGSSGGGVGMDHGQYQNMINNNNNNGWVHQKMAPPSCGEYRNMVEDDDNFLSWRLNVTDQSRNFVHDFTR